ncbi:MAG: sialidase family protein [Polyangiales bacterium]
MQVLKNPNDPNALIVRYGIASEGLLFSRDGGHSFRALCTSAIQSGVDRISVSGQNYRHPIVIDGKGQLLVSTFDALWSDDGTGCNWKPVAGADGKWVASITIDPKTKEAIALANVSTQDGDDLSARAELLRRTADGGFEVVGTLKTPDPLSRTYAGDLLAAVTETGTKLYAVYVSSTGPIDAPQLASVTSSEDGGKTWTEHPLPDALQDLSLVAVDPTAPNRVLAAIKRSDIPDRLFLSEDGAKTFREYGTVQETSGVTFAPDGRVFIGDAGNASAGSTPGGVYTAAKLGQPLTKVPASTPVQSDDVDCIDYDAAAKKLRVCKLHRFGELDWTTGAFTELTQIEATAGLLECPGKDVKAICEPQLNAGSSWCCTGHYPFTGFCGEWDIRTQRGKRVACGLSGREADIAAGRGPMINDAGVPSTPPPGNPDGAPLMSVYGDAPSERGPARATASSAAGGCALGAQSGRDFAGLSLLALGALIVRRVRRKRVAHD